MCTSRLIQNAVILRLGGKRSLIFYSEGNRIELRSNERGHISLPSSHVKPTILSLEVCGSGGVDFLKYSTRRSCPLVYSAIDIEQATHLAAENLRHILVLFEMDWLHSQPHFLKWFSGFLRAVPQLLSLTWIDHGRDPQMADLARTLGPCASLKHLTVQLGQSEVTVLPQIAQPWATLPSPHFSLKSLDYCHSSGYEGLTDWLLSNSLHR